MDYSSDASTGQQDVLISAAVVTQMAQVCDSMQMLRAWHENFEKSLRQVDRVAAIKAYDLMVEGVVTARGIARTLGFTLPDVDDISWALSPRPERSTVEL
jgi:hypothetical protein